MQAKDEAMERKQRGEEIKKKKEEAIKRRQQEIEEEEKMSRESGGADGGMPDMSGAPPGMEKIFRDPEIMAAMNKPKV